MRVDVQRLQDGGITMLLCSGKVSRVWMHGSDIDFNLFNAVLHAQHKDKFFDTFINKMEVLLKIRLRHVVHLCQPHLFTKEEA